MAILSYSTWRDKFFEAVRKPTINVLKILGHSSATVDHWAAIGHAQFTKLELNKRHREIVILLTAAKYGSNYEWAHHVPLSAKAGITDLQRFELARAGKSPGHFAYPSAIARQVGFDQADQVLLAFLENVIEQGVVDDYFWPVIKANFSDRQVVEIISMQGFYYTFARLTTVLRVEFDGMPNEKL